ncbi:MAG TPA: hypothetical protein VMF57_11620 [Solirubrobacteraceae bacterium]|nr:hypothetical protein [Solirubrobacteraceae bacterium]
MGFIAAIALLVVLALTVAGFRALTRSRALRKVDPDGNQAAKQWEEVKERQRNIAGFWGGFLP